MIDETLGKLIYVIMDKCDRNALMLDISKSTGDDRQEIIKQIRDSRALTDFEIDIAKRLDDRNSDVIRVETHIFEQFLLKDSIRSSAEKVRLSFMEMIYKKHGDSHVDKTSN